MSENEQDPFAEDSKGQTPPPVPAAQGQGTPPAPPAVMPSGATHVSVVDIAPVTKKVFSKADIKRSVEVALHFPKLYPDFEPWVFEFRLKLSKEAEERRQEYLSLAAAEMTVKLQEQALDEVCDLLVSMPQGFGDLQETGKGPGHSFRSYVETSDPDMKDQLLSICEGADNLYWASISPREFHR